jgi:uncharacterized Rossmann fold enzyme
MLTKRPTIDPQKRTVKDAPQHLGALSISAIGGKEENPNNKEKNPKLRNSFPNKREKKKKLKENRVILE